MASSWGTSWGTSWADSWGAGVAVPPAPGPGISGGFGGGGGGWIQYGKRKRKTPLHDLFREIEECIRAQVMGEEPVQASVEPAKAVQEAVADDPGAAFDELVRIASERKDLKARVDALRKEMDEYKQHEKLLDEDDEWFMMHG